MGGCRGFAIHWLYKQPGNEKEQRHMEAVDENEQSSTARGRRVISNDERIDEMANDNQSYQDIFRIVEFVQSFFNWHVSRCFLCCFHFLSQVLSWGL